MKRGEGRGVSSLPVPKASKGSPSTAASHLSRGRGNIARSAEDLPRQVNLSVGSPHGASTRRAFSPGNEQRKALSPARTSASQPGVRYITEDMIRKQAKEENFDMITTLNLTLTREGGKKIRYIENLDKLRKLQTLNLSSNQIEKMEKLEKLFRLRELNLSHNAVSKIEGIEGLVFLQRLNLSWNQIEHIPPWIGKKLKALRNINLSNNKLASLHDLSKLKPIPDLTNLDVSGNPLSELPHSRLFIIFHLRTVATLDGTSVTKQEREYAQERFAQGEVERLEKQLEQEETRNRKLEESHNKSLQEKSQQEASAKELELKDKAKRDQISQLQRELDAKNDLLKKKTQELNKACEKHYQLEQELAFYKIDSKFESLGDVPYPESQTDDDSGLLGESPYIGRARYKANQFSQENMVLSSPQKVQIHSLSSSPATPARPPEVLGQLQRALDAEVKDKQREVQLAEHRLQELQSTLNNTEEKLIRATNDLKRLSERQTPESFRNDNKYKIRQRLARKMKTVNEMRDSATQMEDEIDRRQQMIQEKKSKMSRLKEQLTQMPRDHPEAGKKRREMADKEQQISEDGQTNSQLQEQLYDMMEKIAKETTDIKKLEQQLNEERIEANEELRAELDDVVDGLQGYLQNVKEQNSRHKEDLERVQREKENLEETVRQLEGELQVMDMDVTDGWSLQKQLEEAQHELKASKDLNQSLNDQLHRSRQLDPQLQDRLEHAETESRNLHRSLNETEKRFQTDRKNLERQLQVERERSDKMARQQDDGGRALRDLRKAESQLEALKAQNTSLRDQLDDTRKQNESQGKDTFRPSDLKRRLKDLTHNFRTGKGPIPPSGDDDILGRTFNDLHHFVHDKLNKSNREAEDAKKNAQKASVEIQTLRENLKKAETVLAKKGVNTSLDQTLNSSRNEEAEIQRLEVEVRRLKKVLQDAQNRATQGIPRTRIVYATGSDSDRASSLNSDEKALFDELQRELMELRRNMRTQEDDNERRAFDAENEVVLLTEEMQKRENEFERELEKRRQEAELMKEKQEVRIQVIAEDLDQAQQTADHLQNVLDAREVQINEDMQEADVSNQMISAQEEELSRLYDILEAQKDEIGHLNQMLNHLAQQGPQGVGPAFDDELWRIRQEVNNLKETLAMQSAYVETMSVGVSTDPMQAGVSTGVGAAPGGLPVPVFMPPPHPGMHYPPVPMHQIHNPASASAPAPGSPVRQAMRPVSNPAYPSVYPSNPGRVSAPVHLTSMQPHPQQTYLEQKSSKHFSPGQIPQGQTSANQGPLQQSSPGQAPLQHSSPGQGPLQHSSPGHAPQHSSPGQPPVQQSSPQYSQATSAPSSGLPAEQFITVPIVGGNLGSHLNTPPRIHMLEHIGTERREAKTPPGSRGLRGKSEQSSPGKQASPPNTGNRDASGDHNSTQGTGRNLGRSRIYTRRKPSQPSAFEPVYRPQPQHPQYIGLPPPPYGSSGIQPSSGGVFVGSHPVPGSVPAAGYVDGTAGYAPASAQTDPRVAFNPVNTEYSYPAGYTDPNVSSHYAYTGTQFSAGPVNVGSRVYVPSGPAQSVPYQTKRVYYSSGRKNPVRIYYPANGRIPLTTTGVPPPPPMHNVGVVSPGPRPSSMPVTPVATGTPISNSRLSTVVNMDSSYMVPPSPIRPVAMDSPGRPRGILKNAEVAVDDESYLYCNVPEHHDLEDYIAELQEKLRKLKIKVSHHEEIHEEVAMDEEKRLIHRLRSELEDRRDELEGLDLAIERQKKNMRKLKVKEKHLNESRMSAKEELDFLRTRNIKSLIHSRHRKYEEDDSFEESGYRNRQSYLKDEINCLEKTLAKRTGQLREADRLLKECNADLKDAREQARDTVKQYDTASLNLQTASLEAKELEKRATDAGTQLVKTQDQLNALRADVRTLERKREKQEKLLRDVVNVIAKKDAEFKDVDSKVQSASKSLQRVTSELSTAQMKEKETIDALRDSDDLLSKRRLELSRLREQLESQRGELEKLDQTMGKKKTELQLMTQAMERRQSELSSVLREAETEITNKHRELRDLQEQSRTAEQQKADLLSLVKSKRAELTKTKSEVEQEDEVLQRLVGSVNKHKAELKHVYEMQKFEQTELESLKAQHNQKIAELEKTQRMLLEEKSELEQLNTETSRKSAEVERLRQTLERERQEVDHLTVEKQALEDRISTLVRERDMLNENCKNLDDKLNQMKRNHRIMDEKIETTSDRLERLESELRHREREMEDANHQKSLMQKDVNSLKQNIKESRSELQGLEENIQESEEHLRTIEQTLRDTSGQRDDAKGEIERLNEVIRTSRLGHEEALRQEKLKKAELQDLLQRFDCHDTEYQTARQALSQVKQDVENEEDKLNRLVGNANLELESLRSEMNSKREELATLTQEISSLKSEVTHINVKEEKFAEMDKKIKDLEHEVTERNDEKQELAKALTLSYEELQKLRQEANEEQERLNEERVELQNTLQDVQEHLERTKQEMTLLQSRSTGQVSELQDVAEEHFNRANRLNDELSRLKREVINTRKQLLAQDLLNLHIVTLEEALSTRGQGDLTTVRDAPLGDSVQQSGNDSLSDDKENRVSRRDLSPSLREAWRKEMLKDQLVEEQDQLRHQLRQQMLRHAEVMESTRLQSEGTIESLKRKLNTLQEVLFNNNQLSDIRAIHDLTRSRSNTPPRSPLFPRNRSPSPRNRYGHSYLVATRQARSRSGERSGSQLIPERDLM